LTITSFRAALLNECHAVKAPLHGPTHDEACCSMASHDLPRRNATRHDGRLVPVQMHEPSICAQWQYASDIFYRATLYSPPDIYFHL